MFVCVCGVCVYLRCAYSDFLRTHCVLALLLGKRAAALSEEDSTCLQEDCTMHTALTQSQSFCQAHQLIEKRSDFFLR